MTIDLGGGEPRVERYWDLKFAAETGRGEAEWLEGLRWHLQDSVSRHLISDVPIGAFLERRYGLEHRGRPDGAGQRRADPDVLDRVR